MRAIQEPLARCPCSQLNRLCSVLPGLLTEGTGHDDVALALEGRRGDRELGSDYGPDVGLSVQAPRIIFSHCSKVRTLAALQQVRSSPRSRPICFRRCPAEGRIQPSKAL